MGNHKVNHVAFHARKARGIQAGGACAKMFPRLRETTKTTTTVTTHLTPAGKRKISTSTAHRHLFLFERVERGVPQRAQAISCSKLVSFSDGPCAHGAPCLRQCRSVNRHYGRHKRCADRLPLGTINGHIGPNVSQVFPVLSDHQSLQLVLRVEMCWGMWSPAKPRKCSDTRMPSWCCAVAEPCPATLRRRALSCYTS